MMWPWIGLAALVLGGIPLLRACRAVTAMMRDDVDPGPRERRLLMRNMWVSICRWQVLLGLGILPSVGWGVAPTFLVGWGALNLWVVHLVEKNLGAPWSPHA